MPATEWHTIFITHESARMVRHLLFTPRERRRDMPRGTRPKGEELERC